MLIKRIQIHRGALQDETLLCVFSVNMKFGSFGTIYTLFWKVGFLRVFYPFTTKLIMAFSLMSLIQKVP